MTDGGVLFLARHWHEPRSELAFVTRSLAAAATRIHEVTVVAPGPEGETVPDGGFDVMGSGPGRAWRLPPGLPSHPAVIVDEVSPTLSTLLSDLAPTAAWFISSALELNPPWRRITAAGGGDGTTDVGLHVPVNRMAERHRHHGFGFVGYQLVLSGDVDGSPVEPEREVKELGASFPDDDIVLVKEGRAQAWRGSVLRGEISVDTRMDLWRLLAHALFVVDLAPGPHLARECVEALRFGTPIVVPTVSPAAAEHARATGGEVFDDLEGLVSATSRLSREPERSRASALGRRYADERYGRPAALVARLGALFGGSGSAAADRGARTLGTPVSNRVSARMTRHLVEFSPIARTQPRIPDQRHLPPLRHD